MMKLLSGLIVAVVVAVGGYFGVELYLQQRAERDVDTAFEQIRAAGGKLSHGKIAFQLHSRRLTIDDIAGESTTGSLGVKIASLVLSGVGQPDPMRFSADRIEAIGVVATGKSGVGGDFVYKVPELIATGVSAPMRPMRAVDTASPFDFYRFVLEHAATVTAGSITVPSLAATVTMSGAAAVDYTYTDIALRDLRDGKIPAMTAARTSYTADVPQNGRLEKIRGEIANMAAFDFDSRAALAALDPALPSDDTTSRVYRQLTFGAYTAALPNGVRVRVDGLTIDDIGLRPSKFRLSELPALLAAIPVPGTRPTPAQSRLVMEKQAGFYEGVRIGNAEIRGVAFDTPQGPFKLAAFRFNIDNGKFGEIVAEGLDAVSPKGPVQVGRFALKSLDVARLMRFFAQFPAGQSPSPDRLLGLLPLLEGVEIREFVAPYKDSAKPVRIEHASLDWGQFVGPIPGKVRLVAKLSGPIDANDTGLEPLVAAGMDRVTVNLDLAETWSEAARSLVLDPGNVEVAGVAALAARVSLGNVSRALFSLDAARATIIAMQVEAGPIEISLRDLGAVDLAVAQFARAQKLDNGAARRAIVDSINNFSAAQPVANPVTDEIAKAAALFVENSGATLTLKLTPLGKVSAMQLAATAKADPAAVLALFRIEVSTDR